VSFRRIPEGKKQEEGAKKLRLDLLAFLIAINVAIIAYWLYTQVVDQNATLALKLLLAPSLISSGLAFGGVVRHGLSFDWWYTASDWLKIAMGTALATTAIVIIGIGLQAAFPPVAITGGQLDPTQTRIFYMNQGAGEEFFFNYFIFALLLTVFAKWGIGFLAPIFASLLDAGFFTIYHLAVYGSEPALLAFTLCARIALCLVYAYTGKLSASLLPHMIINFMVG
jgi:membrane protease YdiL (CAAX protease family)